MVKCFRMNNVIFVLLCLLVLVSCQKEGVESVFISEVFEYVYAPGQHADRAKSTDVQYMVGDPSLHSGWLFLGGFGGFVIAGFPRNIANGEGYDLEVFSLPGAGPEPAIVSVMQDLNGNGQPDEQWYELAGSLNDVSDRNYQLTYYKPLTNASNVRWSDNRGQRGELIPGFGQATSVRWWWSETAADSITFRVTRLPDVYERTTIHGVDLWTVPEGIVQWGYAENSQGVDFDTENGTNRLDIQHAIDSEGKSVQLPHIRFVKIQTAVFQRAGMLNEISAEIRGVRSRF